MPDFVFLMHGDCVSDEAPWEPYLHHLNESGAFQGGSAIGEGVCARKAGAPAPLTANLVGFIRINADSLDAARSLLAGNPVFEAGGTVEIRELPTTDE
jgi:hypothetical protein